MKIKPLVVLCAAALAASITLPANADVTLDDKADVSLFGDLRIRGEMDDSETANGTERDRARFRYRARVGIKFAPAENWKGQIRFATNTSGLNSPHTTFSTGNTNGADLGIDQAFLTYTANENNAFVFGKTPLNFWNTTETFWDADINVDGAAWVYNNGSFTFNSAYTTVVEGSWGTDTSVFLAQGIYKTGGFKVALGNALVSAPTGTFQAENHLALTAEYKTGDYRFSTEYIDSDADVESTAYTLQARYKINDDYGIRAYWFHTEAFSVLGDGTFGQDDFPNPGNTGVSNFEGFRVQLDYKVNDKMSFDLKWFDMERIVDTATLPATASDAIFNEFSRTRLQFNLNYKF